MAPVLARLRRRISADDGFSLVEAIIALLILGVVSSGFSYGMTMTLRVTRDDRLRQQATHLAERELEVARNQFNHADTTGQASILATGTLIDQAPLPGGTAGQDLTVDGRRFRVVRTHEIQLNGDGASPCEGGGSVDYLTIAVDVEVSWSDSGQSHTVQSQTLLTPVKGVEGDVGFVAAKLTGATGLGTDHVTVTASGPGGTLVRTTAGDGCAVFMFATAGTYTVSLNQSGYVNSEGFQSVSKTAALEIGKLKVLPFSYEQAGTLAVTYATDTGFALPTTQPRITLFNPGIVSGELFRAVTGSTTQVTGLWPYPDGYAVWAGGCDQNDPAATGSQRPASSVAPAGGTLAVTAYLAGLRVRTVHLSGGVLVPAAGVALRAVPADTTGCTTADQPLALGTTDAIGVLSFALPAGTWTIQPLAPYACSVVVDANCPNQTDPVIVTDAAGQRPTPAPQDLGDMVVLP